MTRTYRDWLAATFILRELYGHVEVDEPAQAYPSTVYDTPEVRQPASRRRAE